MGIRGIIERGLQFPRLGSIRKGEQIPFEREGKPVKNNKGEIKMIPVERPYFVFSCDLLMAEYIPEHGITKKVEAEQRQKHKEQEYKMQIELLTRIYDHYGTNQIIDLTEVYLPYPEAHSALSFWLEAYVANRKVAQSDEATVTYLFDTKTGERLITRGLVVRHSSDPNSVAGSLVKDIPIGGVLPYEKGMVVGETKTKNDPIMFKPVGRLNIVFPFLQQAATWMVFTGAWADISSIYSAVEMVNQISKATMQPANTIPLRLRRVPREKDYEDENGKTKTSTKYYIEARVESAAVPNLLTMYEETPFQFQLQSGYNDDDEFENFTEPVEDVEPEIPMEAVVIPEADENTGRPYPPELLKTSIKGFAQFHREQKTNMPKNSPQILAKHLTEIFGNDTDRYVLCAWLFDQKGDTKSMTQSQILAILEWIEVKGFGSVRPEYVETEARVALEYINAQHGQKPLK